MRSAYQMRRIVTLAATVLVLFSVFARTAAAADENGPGRTRLEQILQKQREGGQLSDDERAFLERARERRRKPSIRQPRETTGLVPLTEMADGNYKGQSGGLYGNGKNAPPSSHRVAAEKALAKIQPVDAEGQPSKTGRIGLISVGMSNTTQEFSVFKKMAEADPKKSAHVLIVDCAQGGMSADIWAHPEKATERGHRSPWRVMDERMEEAGLSGAQVQAAWVKQALPGPQHLGPFPRHARAMQGELVVVLQELERRFPNLRVAYLSSRIYAGYATTGLNPEPYAYESAFTVRWLIEDQIQGKGELNYDPGRGDVKSALLLWGPYLWADGLTARKSDGLVWKQEDLSERDGTHPSESGRRKVAEMLLKFFKTNPSAGTWFLK